MMTYSELKKLDVKALEKESNALKAELFNLKLNVITGQLKDTSQFMKLRRQIARVQTVIQQHRNLTSSDSII
jgi:large subunit ribosomal protein L29